MKNNRAPIIFGLGFGDEGKGAITDFMTRKTGAAAVVRFNGGAQAGHNVIAPDGRWHCFSQFGSGTFNPDVLTYLSPEMVVELENLAAEADVLAGKGVADIRERLAISAECTVITPAHKMIGRMRELARGTGRHGSCGLGVGEAILDRENGGHLTVGTALVPRECEKKLASIFERKFAEARRLMGPNPSAAMTELHRYFRERCDAHVLAARYSEILASVAKAIDYDCAGLALLLDGRSPIVFEGAQGTLIDRRYGFAPHITKSRATYHNAMDLLAGARALLEPWKIGVVSAAMTRHGAGPFVTEDESLRRQFDETHNKENAWQGKVRVGHLDLVSLRYAIEANDGVDDIALTNLDRLTGLPEIRLCTSYGYVGSLAILDVYCQEWIATGGNGARITKLRKVATNTDDPARSRMLSRCRPLDWITLPGWSDDISGARRWRDLPANAQRLVRFLDGRLGLNARVSLLSVGPRADQKFFVR